MTHNNNNDVRIFLSLFRKTNVLNLKLENTMKIVEKYYP